MTVEQLKTELSTLLPNYAEYDVSETYNINRGFVVTVLYHSITVTNEEGDSIDLENFVFQIKGKLMQHNDELHIKQIYDLNAYNLRPTTEMLASNYVHSHVNSYSSTNVCLGNTELQQLHEKLCTSRSVVEDLDMIAYFVWLDLLFHTESLDGGPYHYIADVQAFQYDNQLSYTFDEYNAEMFFNDYHNYYYDYQRLHLITDDDLTIKVANKLNEVNELYMQNSNVPEYQEAFEYIKKLYKSFIKTVEQTGYVHYEEGKPITTGIDFFVRAWKVSDKIKTDYEQMYLFYDLVASHLNDNILDVLSLKLDNGRLNNDRDDRIIIECNQLIINETSAQAIVDTEDINYLHDYLSNSHNLFNELASNLNESFYINNKIYNSEVPDAPESDYEVDIHEFYIRGYVFVKARQICQTIQQLKVPQDEIYNEIERNSINQLIAASC